MKLHLTSSSPQVFEINVCYVEKRCISLSGGISIPKNTQQNKIDELTKRMRYIEEIFPSKEWIFSFEFRFYDPESPKLEIAVEGELLKTLHDVLYYGSENERLHVSLQGTANYAIFSNKQEISFKTDMEVDMSEHVEKHFRYIGKEIILPGGSKVWKSSLELKGCKISVALEVNDIVDLTGLLPHVSDKNAKMLEEKLFCDLELISSDGISIPCHKAMLSTCSDMFKAKCEGKLNEPSKNQLTLDMTAESVNALLEFIYCGETRKPLIKSRVAFELFQAGHKYGINGLEHIMVSIFLQKSYEWFDIDVAFDLLGFTVNYDGECSSKLMEKAIKAVVNKSEKLSDCVLVKETFTKSPLLAVQMFSMMAQKFKKLVV